MTWHLYLVPAIGDGTKANPRRPKYLGDMVIDSAAIDYGFQPIFLAAADLTDTQHASITGNADVISFPLDLTAVIGGGQALQNARNALEAALVPAQWVKATDTWAFVAHTVGAMFQFMQRLNFYLGNEVLIDSSTKLNIQWQNVPVDPYQTAILNTAQSFNYDTSFIAGNTQLRVLLENFAGQWGQRVIHIGMITV